MLFIVAERLGRLLEEPLSDNAFGLPMERFCATLASDLLGPENPLAQKVSANEVPGR